MQMPNANAGVSPLRCAPVEMTIFDFGLGENKQQQRQPQIPGAFGRTFGDDNQRGSRNRKRRSRSPSGMTTKGPRQR
jgi:hypothetical protein